MKTKNEIMKDILNNVEIVKRYNKDNISVIGECFMFKLKDYNMYKNCKIYEDLNELLKWFMESKHYKKCSINLRNKRGVYAILYYETYWVEVEYKNKNIKEIYYGKK